MSIEQNSRPASAGLVFDWTASVTRVATDIVLVILVLLVCTEAFLRGAFDYSLGFAEEITGYCVAMLCLFGAALSLRRGIMFRVHFLFDTFTEGAKIWITRVFALLAIATCAVLIWKTGDLVESSLSRGRFSPTVLRTPLWIPQLLLPAGFTLIGVFLVEQFLLTLNKFKEKS